MMDRQFVRGLQAALFCVLLSACGGGSGSSGNAGPQPEPPTTPVELTQLVSSPAQYEARVRFAEPRLMQVKHGGTEYTEVLYEGLEKGTSLGGPAQVGKPAVPGMYRLLAVPMGATASLEILGVQSRQVPGTLLMPHQPSAVDAEPGAKDGQLPDPAVFQDPPFTKDDAAYASDATFPSEVVSIRSIGRMRDLDLLQVTIAPIQYNAAQRTLTLNDAIEFRVTYDGGQAAFLPDVSAHPFEASNYGQLQRSAVLNGDLIFTGTPFIPGITQRLGAELLIFTPPTFKTEADTLADWKREKGISTSVHLVAPTANGGVGTTKEQIRDFIQDKYDTALPRPSYVLLLGDAEFIPPFYRSSSGSPTTGTDLDYSLMTPGDLIADLGVARIPVDTAQQASDVINKIVAYEKTPPVLSPDFYRTAVMAAYFQAARTDIPTEGVTARAYIQTTELVRNAMIAQGYQVDRVYTSDTAYHGTYTGDATPRFYNNLAALPGDLGPGSGFPWNAGTQDVTDAINAGCFLLIHRDHGGQNGWVSPRFRTTDVSSLTNEGLLPVLFSVDCATGLFDNETAGGDYSTSVGGTYLLEAMLRLPKGGVVGALGDTRDSPTWANNALTRGFCDAVFPTVLPSYGGTNSIRRLADILNYGKLYMFSQVGVVQTAGTIFQSEADSNNVMWHAFGDPTLEIWTSAPPFVLPKLFLAKLEAARRLEIEYSIDGSTITALQNGLPLGRAIVEEGRAILELLDDIDPKAGIQLSATLPGVIPVQLTNGDPIK